MSARRPEARVGPNASASRAATTMTGTLRTLAQGASQWGSALSRDATHLPWAKPGSRPVLHDRPAARNRSARGEGRQGSGMQANDVARASLMLNSLVERRQARLTLAQRFSA